MGFAAVLGIVTDDIGSAVAEVRAGNFPVAEHGHTLVLGWNRQTLPTLKQVRVYVCVYLRVCVCVCGCSCRCV